MPGWLLLVVLGLMVALAGVPAYTQPAGGTDPALVATGEDVYNENCQTCHGANLISAGTGSDLRHLTANDRPRFQNAVLKGKGQMPPWQGVLEDGQIDAVWAYIMSKSG